MIEFKNHPIVESNIQMFENNRFIGNLITIEGKWVLLPYEFPRWYTHDQIKEIAEKLDKLNKQ